MAEHKIAIKVGILTGTSNVVVVRLSADGQLTSVLLDLLEYGSIIWDPYVQQDINRLERVQRRAARFISRDFRSREEGCVTKMLKDAGLTPLTERRRMLRLIMVMFYKVVKGMVPALPSHDFLTPVPGNKRRIRPRDLISDSCSNGSSQDKSGENLKRLVESGKFFVGTVVVKDIIPDEAKEIKAKLIYWTDHLKLDLILTTGGTGFSPRDVTPEATKAVLEKEALGMTMAMIKGSLDITPKAMLSRLLSGSRGTTLIINLPGSTKGSAECLEIASAGIPHAVDLLNDRLTNVQKTHREMIKQCKTRQPFEEPARHAEELGNIRQEFQSLLDHASQNVDWQEECVEDNFNSSQEYSMLKLIELLIKLAMPSAHPASTTHRILQSLSSSFSTIKNVKSMQKMFNLWILALKSVIEAPDNEAEVDAYVQDAIYSENGMEEPCKMRNFPGETHLSIPSGKGISKRRNLAFKPLLGSDNIPSIQNPQLVKSSMSHSLSQYPSPAGDLKTIILNKVLANSQPSEVNELQDFVETKNDSCSTGLSTLNHQMLSATWEVEKIDHQFTDTRGQMYVVPLRSQNEKYPQKSSKEIYNLNSPSKNITAHYPKRLLMDCDWKTRYLQGELSDSPISANQIKLKKKECNQNVLQDQNDLRASLALDTSASRIRHSLPQALRNEAIIGDNHLLQQETACQLSAIEGQSCDNPDVDVVSGGDRDYDKGFYSLDSDMPREIDSEEVSSSFHNYQDNMPMSNNANEETSKCRDSFRESIFSSSIVSTVSEPQYDKRILSNSPSAQTSDEMKNEAHHYTGTVQKRSLSNDQLEQSSQISSSEVKMKPYPLFLGFKSAKIHKMRNCAHGELVYIPVGKTFLDFVNEHTVLKGINLYKGKRDIKKSLVKLCRQEDIVSQAVSWKRGKEVLERNRFDDYFQLTTNGSKEQMEVHCGKKRDQYVVNWYMWCPGRGNCMRKCGGFGHCLENCKGMLHKQDRHNCSLMVNLKLFLSDLGMWRVHITGSHVPKEHETSSTHFPSSNESALPQTRSLEKPYFAHSANMTNETAGSNEEKSQAIQTIQSSSLSLLNNTSSLDNDNELATSKIPSKKRISKMISNLKRRRKGRPCISKLQLANLKNLPLKGDSRFDALSSNLEKGDSGHQSMCVPEIDHSNVSNDCMLNSMSKVEDHQLNRVFPVSNVLPLACYHPTVSDSIISRPLLPVCTSANISSDLYVNLQPFDKTLHWGDESMKDESSSKCETEMSKAMPSTYGPLTNMEEDFQQSFLHANTLCDILHQASSELPPQLEDLVDVMANSTWENMSKESEENLQLTSLSNALSHCSGNLGDITLNSSQSDAQVRKQFLIADNSSSKSSCMGVQQSIYGNITGQNCTSLEVDPKLLQEKSYGKNPNPQNDCLPSYQEARAALGHEAPSENNFL